MLTTVVIQWDLQPISGGSNIYRLKNSSTGKFIGLNGDAVVGAAIVEDPNGFQWTVVSADDGQNGFV